jgi:hypothetical protein
VQDDNAFVHCRLLVGDSRQLLVRNLDLRNSVLCSVVRFGRDRHDGFPNITDAISRKHWMQRCHIHARSSPVARQVTDALQIAGGEHRDHSRHRPSDRRIDGEETGMRVS